MRKYAYLKMPLALPEAFQPVKKGRQRRPFLVQ